MLNLDQNLAEGLNKDVVEDKYPYDKNVAEYPAAFSSPEFNEGTRYKNELYKIGSSHANINVSPSNLSWYVSKQKHLNSKEFMAAMKECWLDKIALPIKLTDRGPIVNESGGLRAKTDNSERDPQSYAYAVAWSDEHGQPISKKNVRRIGRNHYNGSMPILDITVQKDQVVCLASIVHVKHEGTDYAVFNLYQVDSVLNECSFIDKQQAIDYFVEKKYNNVEQIEKTINETKYGSVNLSYICTVIFNSKLIRYHTFWKSKNKETEKYNGLIQHAWEKLRLPEPISYNQKFTPFDYEVNPKDVYFNIDLMDGMPMTEVHTVKEFNDSLIGHLKDRRKHLFEVAQNNKDDKHYGSYFRTESGKAQKFFLLVRKEKSGNIQVTYVNNCQSVSDEALVYPSNNFTITITEPDELLDIIDNRANIRLEDLTEDADSQYTMISDW